MCLMIIETNVLLNTTNLATWIKIKLICSKYFFSCVVRMNKESLWEKDSETLMNICHLKTILQPIKDPCRIRRFPKQALTSL